MKLKFKQQQYQSDATMVVVNCFEGQNKGERKEIVGRTGLKNDSTTGRAAWKTTLYH